MIGELSKAKNIIKKILPKIENNQLLLREKAIIYERLGVLYNYEGAYKKAIAAFNKSLRISEENDDIQNKISVFNNMSRSFAAINNVTKTILCTQKSIALSKQIGFLNNLGVAAQNLAVLYIRAGKIKKCLEQYFYVVKLTDDHQIIAPQVMVHSNLSYLYNFLGDQQKALFHFNKSQNLAERNSLKYWIGQNYLVLGKIFMAEKNYIKAELNFNKAINYFENLNDLSKIAQVLTELINLYSYFNETNKALAILEKIPGMENKISKRIKEKLFIAKMKIELLVGKEMGLVDKNDLFKTNIIDFEDKFYTYSTAAKYIRYFTKDKTLSNTFAQKAIDIYNQLLSEVPEDMFETVKNNPSFKSFLEEFY